ncbi:MAG: MFS transporter, partial [Clostridia bacterium]|nr:MFS transporter [Clostridia bacterium]
MRFSLQSLLNGVVHTRDEQKNFVYDTLRNVFTGLLPVFASVAIMQAFALENGVPESSIGIFNTVSNVCAVLGMLMVMSAADNVTGKKLVRVTALWNLPVMAMPLLMLVMSLMHSSLSPNLFFWLAVSAFALNAMTLNVRGIFATKLARFTFQERSYGTAFGIGGLIMYVASLLASFTVEPILTTQNGFTVLFALAAASVLGAALFNARIKFLEPDGHDAALPQQDTPQQKITLLQSVRTVLSQKSLRLTLLLHIGRGVISSFVYCFVLFGTNHFEMPLSGAAYLTVITTFASIAAYLLVTLLYNRLGSVLSSYFSLGLCAVGVVLMLIVHNPSAFYAAVAIFQIGNIFYSQLIPFACCKVADPKILG